MEFVISILKQGMVQIELLAVANVQNTLCFQEEIPRLAEVLGTLGSHCAGGLYCRFLLWRQGA